jgi:hypothetical protein
MTRLSTFSAKQKEAYWNEKAPSGGWRGLSAAS